MAIFKGKATNKKIIEQNPCITIRRKTKYISTNENWYPTKNNKVEVDLLLYIDFARVTVCGADDYFMEKEFKGDNYLKQAQNLFDILTDFTTQNKMKQLGMILG